MPAPLTRRFRVAFVAAAVLLGAASPPPVPSPVAAMDQAYVVPLPVAKAAIALVSRHDWVVLYCEPCDDPAPVITDVQTVAAQPWEGGQGQWVVTVNGEGIDLAYTFVPIGGSGFAANLALLTGMDELHGVSPTIPVGDPELGEH